MTEDYLKREPECSFEDVYNDAEIFAREVAYRIRDVFGQNEVEAAFQAIKFHFILHGYWDNNARKIGSALVNKDKLKNAKSNRDKKIKSVTQLRSLDSEGKQRALLSQLEESINTEYDNLLSVYKFERNGLPELGSGGWINEDYIKYEKTENLPYVYHALRNFDVSFTNKKGINDSGNPTKMGELLNFIFKDDTTAIRHNQLYDRLKKRKNK